MDMFKLRNSVPILIAVISLSSACGSQQPNKTFETEGLNNGDGTDSYGYGKIDTDHDAETRLTDLPDNYLSKPVSPSIGGYEADSLYPFCEEGYCISYCPDDYSRVDNCINRLNPPSPSIRRAMVHPGYSEHDDVGDDVKKMGTTETDRLFESPYESFPIDGGEDRVMIPGFERSTNDGRLHWSREGNSGFHLFRPERLQLDGTIQAGLESYEKPYVSGLSIFQPPGQTRMTEEGKLPSKFHNLLCDASGLSEAEDEGQQHNIRSCEGRLSNDDVYIDGDCYDLSIIYFLNQKSPSDESFSGRSEIHSVDVTVFVPRAKTKDAGIWDLNQPWRHGDRRVLMYPRTTETTLPAYNDGGYHPWSDAWQHVSGDSFESLASVVNDKCAGAEQPGWCRFHDVHYYNQEDFFMDFADDNVDHYWSGFDCVAGAENCSSQYQLFEPSINADGRLMMINSNNDIYYSYNDVGPCRADGWTTWHPLSHMPFDSNIRNHYPIGEAMRNGAGQPIPFRYSDGSDIPDGAMIHGAYPWMDRNGRNVFFAAQNKRRNHIKSIEESGYVGHRGESYNGAAVSGDATLNRPDGAAAKQVSVIGAWTQGQMIVLDNNLNFTDFGGAQPVWWSGRRNYKLRLYQNEDVWVRPHGSSNIFSMEHVLNQYESLKPRLPFDVVWKVSSDNLHTTEVVFDDYVRNDILINLPMNAPMKKYKRTHTLFPGAPTDIFFPDDGFEPVFDDGGQQNAPKSRFVSNPRLQNTATSSTRFMTNALTPPRNIELRGGARIEPVGMGGVVGKGVYLDGKDDFIDVEMVAQDGEEWLVSAWIDSRELDPTRLRTLFYFGDHSFIQISRERILFFDRFSSGQKTRTVNLERLGLDSEQFIHVAFRLTREEIPVIAQAPAPDGPIEGGIIGQAVRQKVQTRLARVIRTYVNGTRLPNQKVIFNAADGHKIGMNFSEKYVDGKVYFLVGDPGPDHGFEHYLRNPIGFKGWVDDVRVERLNQHSRHAESFTEETLCNLAYGTLVSVAERDGFENGSLLQPLAMTASRYGYFDASTNGVANTGRAARVCERLDISSFAEPDIIPPQRDAKACVNDVHRKGTASSVADRCVREERLGMADKPLIHDAPRPDFVDEPFCLACHQNNNTFDGLNMIALTGGSSILRADDKRRQPHDAPARIFGCVEDALISGDDRCHQGSNGVKLDALLDIHGAIFPDF